MSVTPAVRIGASALAGAFALLLGMGTAHPAPAPKAVPKKAEPGIMSAAALEGGLRRAIARQCQRPGSVSVHVRSLTAGETLFSHEAREKRIPASNLKLATTAAALARLGPDYTFPTDVYSDGAFRGPLLAGNLYFKGYGDPFLVQERVRELAHELRARGLRRVKGDLVADETYFDSERFGKGWHAEGSLRPYQAPHGALSFNFNVIWVIVTPGQNPGEPARVRLDAPAETVRLEGGIETGPRNGRPAVQFSRHLSGGLDRIRVGGTVPAGGSQVTYPVTISDPAMYAAGAFALFLKEAGILLEGRIRRGSTPADAELLARTLSRPLGELVRDVNKISNNFMAEQILKTLGAEEHGLPGTAEKGVRAVRDFLVSVGVPADGFELADGSGLSRLNRFSAEGLVALLEGVHRDFRLRPEFEASLAVVGVDGTVRKKLQRTGSVRRVRVKSGLLDGVQSLSGYGLADNGELIAFAIISNDSACHAERLFRDMILDMTDLDRPLPPALAHETAGVRRTLALPMPDPRRRDSWRARHRARLGPAPETADTASVGKVKASAGEEVPPAGLSIIESESAPPGDRGARP
ncbi:MAG: D-alanyl-D-alanine carboxypeptidase/D-alanyl-D-alanine-endopeptidase [Candidatus Tectomicrobia bacterium]|uniref:D-alanyl-D-alanine carboxypeptidase/D-alanyl-D-alanine-endopeptidase n=1 Tax=Tectimicrobiota bacterium TaxID=2528274 RepID=A0A932HYY5_UNCTE|nr:D-alanyl-D-alanine carboxypeptidase/D-alanyl-D-alanine-endopeptidase [Candidatus Tectomicrobia bacterium]